MSRQYILGLSSAALLLFMSMAACDKVNLTEVAKVRNQLAGSQTAEGGPSGGGAGDIIKNIIPDTNMPVPPLVVNGVGEAAYLWEVGLRTPENNDQVIEIFKRLKEAARDDKEYGARANELENEWKLNTLQVEKPSTPAAAFPGGGIAVYTGYFRIIPTEGVLASILGHEMAHLLSQHHLQRWNRAAAAALLDIGPKITSGERLDKMDPKVIGPVLGAMGIGYIIGEDLPLERGKELEADCSGLILAAKAGYNPIEAEQFWHNQDDLATKNNSNDSFQLFKLHPAAKDRYSHISKTCLAAAQTAFNQVDAGKRQNEPVEFPKSKVS